MVLMHWAPAVAWSAVSSIVSVPSACRAAIEKTAVDGKLESTDVMGDASNRSSLILSATRFWETAVYVDVTLP